MFLDRICTESTDEGTMLSRPSVQSLPRSTVAMRSGEAKSAMSSGYRCTRA